MPLSLKWSLNNCKLYAKATIALIDLRLYTDRLRPGELLYNRLVWQYGTGKVPPEYLDEKADLWGL